VNAKINEKARVDAFPTVCGKSKCTLGTGRPKGISKATQALYICRRTLGFMQRSALKYFEFASNYGEECFSVNCD
jgi:hypothetical protein